MSVLDPQFLQAFCHVIQIQRWTGAFDEFGAPQHDATVLEFPARISGKKLAERRSFTDEDNQEVFDIWFDDPDDHLFTVNDKVILPDVGPFAENRYPAIYSVGRITRWDNFHHVKMQCGWQYHRQGQ